MAGDNNAVMDVLMRRVGSVRNLMPRDTAVACDHNADSKARWTAFDRLFESVIEGCKPAELATLGWPIEEGPTSDDALRQLQRQVAMALIGQHFQGNPDAAFEMMVQAEALVPTPPDPDTGQMPFTTADQAVLWLGVKYARDEFPEESRIFFRAESEPVERRRRAFRTLYALIGATWMHESLKARQMEPIQRQRLVVLALMSVVPADQWNNDDLERLWSELLPVDEPKWRELAPELG
ncbi:MAG: hypothetical protein HONBIEJF_01038 [Fimbriimonadaceae bacterium]|nr:hypothetical protein [Fimbriimonadaceae bacterium]